MYSKKVRKHIVLLPGDGVGPEVMHQSVKLLQALEQPFGLTFSFEEELIGGAALRVYGVPVREETLAKCQKADAVLLGPIGDPIYENEPEHLQPQRALVTLRTRLGAFCNLRSTRVRNVVPQHLPVTSTVTKDIDIVIVQTMRNGYYFHEYASQMAHWETTPEKSNFSKSEITRVARKTFQLAKIRKRRLTAVTDNSSRTSSRFWRSLVEETHAEFPNVKLNFISESDVVQLLSTHPYELDVVFCESRYATKVNEAAVKLTDSPGMLGSACLGTGVGIYQPVHNPERESVGKNIANPIAMMNSIALMLHYSFDMPLAAHNIEDAITAVLARGYHTIDMPATKGVTIGTTEMVDYVLEEVLHCLGAPIMTV